MLEIIVLIVVMEGEKVVVTSVPKLNVCHALNKYQNDFHLNHLNIYNRRMFAIVIL